MNTIIIIKPKQHRHESNRIKWKFNHHLKPYYLLSEINHTIRKNKNEDQRFLWNEMFKMYYKFKKRGGLTL